MTSSRTCFSGHKGSRNCWLVFVAAAFFCVHVHAIELDAGPGWTVRWDNTISYNLGIRAQDIDDRIGNHPVFAQSSYSYRQGDLVTNRVADLMELDAQHRNGWGLRLSASLFKDFAFHDDVRTNPGELAPGTPYSSLGSYSGNRFSDYTKRRYKQDARLLDAFTYTNFRLGEHESSLFLGRLTKFSGNALFFGRLGINTSQNASDAIKASFAPGTEAKELAIPREQVFFSTQLTQELVAEAQYFFRFEGNLLPEGGTYLSFADFLTRGPQGAALTESLGLGQHGEEVKPKDINNNFGLKLAWAPSAFRGGISGYVRQFDETQPWMPMLRYDPATLAVRDYHLSFPKKVRLFGLAMEKQVGPYSLGAELSHLRGTGLSSSAFNPSDPLGREGARGNVTNLLVNVVGGLTRSRFWDTGVFSAELGYTRLHSITRNAAMYLGVDNPAACPTGSERDGCATKDAWMAAGFFKPQWLAAWPGVDLGLPVFVMVGLKGNASILGAPVGEHSAVYTVGLEANVHQKYTLTLQYNGYRATANGLTNAAAPLGIANGTPGFPTFYAGGNGTWMYNDKGWVLLSLKASF